jgi:CDP-glucose 4,6-dehydratase
LLATAFNFGPREDESVPVGDLAQALVAAMGYGELEVARRPEDPHEASLLRLDCARARALLGWSPRLSTAEAIRITAEYYAACAVHPGRSREIVDRQIREHGHG